MHDAILPNEILQEANITLSEIKDDCEITISQIENDVFTLDQPGTCSYYPGTSSGVGGSVPPRLHNRNGSGDLSNHLIDDFGRPICRITRSMSRSSQSSDF